MRHLTRLSLGLLALSSGLLTAAPLKDGPYVRWVNRQTVSVEAVCDGARYSRQSALGDGTLRDPCTGAVVSTLHSQQTTPENTYAGVRNFLALSDVEGQYDALVQVLRKHGVIDANLKWAYGDGHLVLNGDMVDRGDKVTEVLWLIHRLEQEAAQAGGHVHYLLGNHEKFVLEGDLRYIHDKYKLSTERLGLSYSDLFAPDTELGRWMRTRNAAVRINNILFVHAGLSAALLDHTQDLTEINEGIRAGLSDARLKKTNSQVKWLLSSDGPLWYRGYFREPFAADADVAATLDAMGVDHVAVGHTIVDKIEGLYAGRVIALDTSFKKLSKIGVLVLKNGRLAVGDADGKLKAFTP